jgi:uncharacterized protein YcgI (DUF1989 family)
MTHLVESVIVPAAGGRAVEVAKGQSIRISSPGGGQCADFFAFSVDLTEWVSPMHTWVWTRCVRPRAGEPLLSQRRNPMLDFVEDGAGGVHDMLVAACDPERYRQLGFEGLHASCAENLRTAMAELGHGELPIVPQPVNFFTSTAVGPDGVLSSPSNPVPAGAFVRLKARRDLVCAVSACPFDLQMPGWVINAEGRLSELAIEVLS